LAASSPPSCPPKRNAGGRRVSSTTILTSCRAEAPIAKRIGALLFRKRANWAPTIGQQPSFMGEAALLAPGLVQYKKLSEISIVPGCLSNQNRNILKNHSTCLADFLNL